MHLLLTCHRSAGHANMHLSALSFPFKTVIPIQDLVPRCVACLIARRLFDQEGATNIIINLSGSLDVSSPTLRMASRLTQAFRFLTFPSACLEHSLSSWLP